MTTKAYFKALSVLHAMLLLGQVIFAGIIVLVIDVPGSKFRAGSPTMNSQGYNDVFFYVALSLAAASIVASYVLFRTRVNQIRQKPGISVMLADYRVAVLMRDALVEAPGILATIACFVTLNERCLVISGLVILLFLIWWPARSRVIADLGLEGEASLLNPDAIIE
jgi:hypothetical protein